MKFVTLSSILQVYVWPQHFHSRFVIDDIPFHNNNFPSIAKRFSQFCLSCFWVSVGIATEIRSKGRFANILNWHVGMEPRIKSTRFSWLPNLQPCHCIWIEYHIMLPDDKLAIGAIGTKLSMLCNNAKYFITEDINWNQYCNVKNIT